MAVQDDNLYVSTLAHTIRKLSLSESNSLSFFTFNITFASFFYLIILHLLIFQLIGEVTTYAGFQGENGSEDGHTLMASFNSPSGIAVGKGGLYIADSGSRKIRKIDDDGKIHK